MAISTGTAILGAALIGAAGSLYSGSQQSKAINKASGQSTSGMLAATEMQLKFLREMRADIAKAVEEGLLDLDEGFNMAIKSLGPKYDAVAEYINLLKDPSKVMTRPGVQFQYNQGINALQTGYSKVSGGGLSGDIIASAQEYGQNFAAMALDKELARLTPLIQTQMNRASLYSQEGMAKSNLRVGGTTGTWNLATPMINSAAQGMMAASNTQAQATLGQANTATNTMGSITGTISDLASLYALRPDLFSTMAN